MVLSLEDNHDVQGMLCPHCKVPLLMTSREGVEIDYCPKCRGVWLDRGELDKIVERSLKDLAQTSAPEPKPKYVDEDAYKKRKPYKRRKSWIAEIFDELT